MLDMEIERTEKNKFMDSNKNAECQVSNRLPLAGILHMLLHFHCWKKYSLTTREKAPLVLTTEPTRSLFDSISENIIQVNYTSSFSY